jgi:hypothetical protein
VLLWVDNGFLSGLELSWYTDEAPTGWPSSAQWCRLDRPVRHRLWRRMLMSANVVNER